MMTKSFALAPNPVPDVTRLCDQSRCPHALPFPTEMSTGVQLAG